MKQIYRKSSKETRRSYSFFDGPNAGVIRIRVFLPFSAGIRMRVLFEGGSLLRIYGILVNDEKAHKLGRCTTLMIADKRD